MAVGIEVLFVLALIVLNGVFAMSELAVMSSRKARLQERANQGSAGARVALELVKAPARFLSTVQIGITLVGVLAGAFGGATLASLLSEQFDQVALLSPYSGALGLGTVVALITYLSLVLGELVPKQIALRSPEQIAALVAPAMRALSVAAYPLVRLLSLSTQAVIRAFGLQQPDSPPVTEEEIRLMIREGTQAGVFETAEQDMVESVFRLDDRPISALMTPHTEVAWLDANSAPDDIRDRLIESGHSRLPVCDGSLDNVLGIVHAHALLAVCLSGQTWTITDYLRKAAFVPENAPASVAVQTLRHSEEHMIMVLGEHGGVEGILTDHDILEAIVGDIPSPGDAADPDVVRRDDGSWLLDGMIPVDRLKTVLALKALPDETPVGYQTLAGFILNQLGHIPATGECFHWGAFRFEVIDMDQRRIDKVLVTPLPPPPDDTPSGAPSGPPDAGAMTPCD